MGYSETFYCTKCDWKKTLTSGPSMMEYKNFVRNDISKTFLGSVLKGRFGKPLKAFFEAEKSDKFYCTDQFDKGLYYCDRCYTYKTTHIKKMEYRHGKNVVRAEIIPLCDKCNMEMESVYVSNWLKCPKCGSDVARGGIMLFD